MYNSKVGFTITALKLTDIGSYKCVATNTETGVSEERQFYVQVMKSEFHDKFSCERIVLGLF